MSHVPKAAPSSDLNARQEALLWIVADVVFLGALLLICVLFKPTGEHLPGPDWLTAPLIGWVVGNIVAWVIPHRITTPSWLILVVAVVVVVLIALVFPADSRHIGHMIAGFVVGVTTGYLASRALAALRRARTA
ncbi:hypothetical protein [Luteipulveratus flavus]|uniref:DUF3054 domain-containing protein n=1 Tax=Luteipulveratus flavus TaxID=3031728 RepID=A0ABT6C9J7_9MICO|nr:hypothetical protein [Luteipulveratus sp. YIM 133296]MDF8265582.1 hypothetical protein [Luteipulveratus sp. YIM 133296]